MNSAGGDNYRLSAGKIKKIQLDGARGRFSGDFRATTVKRFKELLKFLKVKGKMKVLRTE